MQKGAHTQYDLQIHVVWITKYRKKILIYKIAYRLKELLMQGCSAKGITIIRGNIQPEHVHLLLSIPPTLSVAQIMQYLKGRSSKKLQEEFPKLRKQFWGQHMWATGYFCRSVGQVTRQTIEEYIENQKDGIEDIFVNDGNSMLQHRRSFSPHSKPCTLSAGWLINYDEEFKKTIVSLYESGKKISELSREYGVGHTNIRNWINKYQKITTSTGETTNNDEILKLKKELQQVQLENEILKKAVAIFSKQQKIK